MKPLNTPAAVRRLTTLVAVSSWFGGAGLDAHPIVPGFEREKDPAAAGLLLLAELNCTACHTPPETWREELAAKPAPRLGGVGSRMSAGAIERFIRDPHQRKPGTTMPALLAGPDAAAIASYLGSLKEPLATMPPGDAARGKQLYHGIGCVACHEPAADAGRGGVGEKTQVAQLPSVPIALAADYEPAALAEFLLDPLKVRPSGRMPSFHLAKEEAADLAAYLREGTHAEPRKEITADVARGREGFTQHRCAACHDTGDKLTAAPARRLAELGADRGCLAPTRTAAAPHFSLNEAQRAALTTALRLVTSGPPPARSPAQKVDAQMARLNCHACHARAGLGGPEPARAQYFTVNDPGAESLGELAHLPPRLDHVGRKLTREWLAKILWGGDGSVRPYMDTRMPDFGRAQTEPLVALLEEADRREPPMPIDVSGLLGHQRAEPGRKLLGATGLGCVSCHGLKDRKSLGPPVIRLTHTAERLQPGWFKELLLDPPSMQPGTVMPPLFTGRKDAPKEIESIWTYLREVDSQPLPEGLFSDADYELKPADAGQPIVLRSFIEGIGTHAIGIGFPQGLNAGFDAKTSRWMLVWRGRFLDALSNWQDRSMKPIAPLGTDVKALPADGVAREYRGYRLDPGGVPVMLYAEAGVEVEDKLEPGADGKSFTRIVKRGANETKEVLSW